MSTLTINGVQYKDFTQAFVSGGVPVSTPIAGKWYALPPFGKPPVESVFDYKRKFITFTGVFDAMGTKRTEPIGKIIACELIITDTSKANVVSAASSAMENMNALERFSITLPDSGTRNNCVALKLLESQCLSMGGAFGIMIDATFLQVQKD